MADQDQRLNDLRQRAIKEMPPRVLYQAERPDARLTATVQSSLDRARPGAFRADCHGFVCQVSPIQPVATTELKAAVGELAASFELQRGDFESKNGRLIQPGYAVLVPRGGRDAGSLLQFFTGPFLNSDKTLAGCREHFSDEGEVSAHLVLDADRISATFAGPGVATPLGKCSTDAVTRAAAAFPVPAGVGRAEADRTLSGQ
jgi:hypothetical protein